MSGFTGDESKYVNYSRVFIDPMAVIFGYLGDEKIAYKTYTLVPYKPIVNKTLVPWGLDFEGDMSGKLWLPVEKDYVYKSIAYDLHTRKIYISAEASGMGYNVYDKAVTPCLTPCDTKHV